MIFSSLTFVYIFHFSFLFFIGEPGKYQPEFGFTGSSCAPTCPKGTFSNEEGLTAEKDCKDCGVGLWSDATGLDSADKCTGKCSGKSNKNRL